MSEGKEIGGPEMGLTAEPLRLWGFPVWLLAPVAGIAFPGGARTLAFLSLPVVCGIFLFSQRTGLPGRWLLTALMAGLPLPLSFAVAAEDAESINPCAMRNPPAWCAQYTPPERVYAPGTEAPVLPPPVFVDSRPAAPQRWLLASTAGEPPAVVWVGGQIEDPVRLFGKGRAASLPRALELILPEGWQVWSNATTRELARGVRPPLLWDAGGRPWTEVIEELAMRYGLNVVADIPKRELTITSVLRPAIDMLSALASLGVDPVTETLLSEPDPGGDEPAAVTEVVVPQAGGPPVLSEPALTPPNLAAQGNPDAEGAYPLPLPIIGLQAHPLYVQFSTPTYLSAMPLPATRLQVAYRIVPNGIDLDFTALGSLQNEPVLNWSLESTLVSPRRALKAILPQGYCTSEDYFPTVTVIPCLVEPVANESNRTDTDEE